MRTLSKLAAAAAASTIVVAGAAGAGAQETDSLSGALGSVGPTGSAIGLPSIPGDIAPAPNRLVASGTSATGTCYSWITADINQQSPGTVRVDWKVHQLGVGTCDLVATLSYHNLDTGYTGEHVLEQNLPGNWPSHGDSKRNVSITTPGNVEWRLETNGGAQAGPIEVVTEG